MRIAVNGSGLLVLLALIITAHSCILSKNLRDMEVSSSLQSSTDYAIDVMGDMYAEINYDKTKQDEYIEKLLTKFCEAMEGMVGSDAEVSVRLKEVNLEQGIFAFVVEEKFSYGFMGFKGKVACERTVVFVGE